MDQNRLEVKLKYGSQLPGTDATPAPEVVRLGTRLYERREEVVRRSEALNRTASVQLDAAAHRQASRA